MITIRPETEGNILVIEASDKLTAKDYEEVFIPKLDQLIHEFKKIRIVFYLNDSFDGWEIGAMWDDAKFGLKHRNDFERIAMVGGSKWLTWFSKFSSHFISGEFRSFDHHSLQDAISWATQ
jgi:hypothetical protein